jgi:hypothetical protein
LSSLLLLLSTCPRVFLASSLLPEKVMVSLLRANTAHESCSHSREFAVSGWPGWHHLSS